MSDRDLRALTSEALLEVSPRDFAGTSGSFREQDQAEQDLDDSINYINVSSVSDNERESEESDDEVLLNVPTSSEQQPMEIEKEKEDFDADNLCNEGQTLLWDLIQDKQIVSTVVCFQAFCFTIMYFLWFSIVVCFQIKAQ